MGHSQSHWFKTAILISKTSNMAAGVCVTTCSVSVFHPQTDEKKKTVMVPDSNVYLSCFSPCKSCYHAQMFGILEKKVQWGSI